jgi:PAS domain S-box-containing protein
MLSSDARSLLEATVHALLSVGTGGAILDANAAAEAITGRTRDELIGSDVAEAFTEPGLVRASCEEALECGCVRHRLLELRRSDGTTMPVSLSAAVRRDDLGRIDGLVVAVVDVAERDRIEEALRTNRAQLSDAVTIARLGPWEYDAETDLFTFNDHFYAMFRTTAEEQGGYTMSPGDYAKRFLPPEEAGLIADEMKTGMEATDPYFSRELEHRIVYADGEIGSIAVRYFVVKDERGRTIKTYGVNQDITLRKRAEERLQASYEALKRADRDRGRLLAQLVSAQEQERLRVADDIHDDSIQVMTAVELRLAALRGQLDPHSQRAIEQLEETVSAAIGRLRHLLFELRPSSLDRLGLVPTLVEYAERMTDQRGPSVTVHDRLVREPATDARVLLYRLTQEALTNVRKHARSPTARVDLRTEGEGTLVRVRDDGVGFDRECSESAAPGALGLISMRERAELAGGWFHAESAPGEGTAVSFWIPG